MKAKSYPPRNSDKKKVVPIHALTTREEYPSGDDASDDEEAGKATIAIVKPTSSSSLFDTSPTYPQFLMLHAYFYTICLMFRYTSWHFYAFSETNLLTSHHSASSQFSAIFVFQK
jgi:hypothetical protein